MPARKRPLFHVVERTDSTLVLQRVKRCYKCTGVKLLSEFHASNKNRVDGKTNRCKSCAAKYQVDNKARLKEYSKTYSRLNRERFAPAKRKWYDDNIEKVKKYHRTYNAANFQALSAKRKVYYQDNKNHFRTYNQMPATKERKRLSEQKRKAAKAQLPHEDYCIQQIIDRDGPLCWMCGQMPTAETQAIEHLVAVQTDPSLLALWGITNPGNVLANVAIACSSCNSRKHSRILVCAVARYLRNIT